MVHWRAFRRSARGIFPQLLDKPEYYMKSSEQYRS